MQRQKRNTRYDEDWAWRRDDTIPVGFRREQNHMHIITCLGGGLGNQLFQYAAGRSLAARTGARLMMDGSRIQAPGGYRYVLGNFAIDAELVFGREHGAAADSIRTKAEDRLEFPIFREHSFDYDPRFETLSAPKILVGFWQSEKYFRTVAGMIRCEFRLIP